MSVTMPARAGEFAVLSNGFRIHAERHEVDGRTVRLFSGGGVTELPASFVSSFEQDGSTPVQPPGIPSQAAPPPPPVDARSLIREAAARAGLPAIFVESVAKAESGMRPDAISPKGAIGVMQLMPATAQAYAVDPRDPAQNIKAGAQLLRELLIKYDGDVVKALSAYNAGEGAVERYRGMPPFAETREYVNKVLRDYIKAGGR
jgi:hypothetical protein